MSSEPRSARPPDEAAAEPWVEELRTAGVVDGPHPGVNELLETIELVDHHTHGILAGPTDAAQYIHALSESDRPAASAGAGLATQVGIAVRRWCGPLLGLPANLDDEAFVEARVRIPTIDAARRLLPAAGYDRLLVETGFRGDELTTLPALAAVAGRPVSAVARLETIAERLAAEGCTAAGFAAAVRDAVDAELAAGAVGLKSIVAYRTGFDIDPTRPDPAEVERHTGDWLRSADGQARPRISDPVLERFLLWTAVDTGRPLQIHTGFGDPDLDLHRADPLLLTDFIRATEGRCRILLLHTYPFHRGAGYLAHVFPHVLIDVGLAVNYVGARAAEVIAESLELAPLSRVLFSADAWGVPELHLLGSWLFRRGLARVLGRWVIDGDWTEADAARAIRAIGGDNARRVYGLPSASPSSAGSNASSRNEDGAAGS